MYYIQSLFYCKYIFVQSMHIYDPSASTVPYTWYIRICDNVSLTLQTSKIIGNILSHDHFHINEHLRFDNDEVQTLNLYI